MKLIIDLSLLKFNQLILVILLTELNFVIPKLILDLYDRILHIF